MRFTAGVAVFSEMVFRSAVWTTAQECSTDLLNVCAPCCRQQETQYNCSHPGLETMTPGIYEGITVNYLSFLTEQSSPNLPIRAEEFKECTGGTVVFSQASNIFIDPIQDLGTKTSRGSEVYDGYFMSYSHFPEASALDLAEPLNERIAADNARLKWEDVLPKVRTMGEYRKNGVTNIEFLMYDGDFFVPIIRLDLLEKYNLPLPNTWGEVVQMARLLNGTDLNGDDDPNDFGFCHFPRKGGESWDWWWPEAIYSTWATYEQTDGINQGFFFDEETMEPRVKGGFERSAEIWKDLWRHGGEGCITENFRTGRCAIGFSPPGCWKGIFLDGVSRKDENGNIIWRPTMKSGEYAEPYRFKPFGSTEVFNRETGELEPCTEELCPEAERIPAKGHLADDDRASILPSSPLEGQLINRVPFYWSGGLGTLIRKSSAEEKKDLMWDFFVYTNSPETSIYDVANYASWLDSWRKSQLVPGDNFLDAGWSQNAYAEHAAIMQWALSADANGAFNLRLPGLLSYTRDTVGALMEEFIEGSISVHELSLGVAAGWDQVTVEKGKLDQLEIYRASLGLDALSEFQLCTLHRKLMDERDPSICRRFDDEENSILLQAILTPSLVVFLAVLAILFFEMRRKNSDSVWAIKAQELRFEDPPEVLGRGTFGLVLLAEYRGTLVAVKRVIPPKEKPKKSKPGIMDSFAIDAFRSTTIIGSRAVGTESSLWTAKKAGELKAKSLDASSTTSRVFAVNEKRRATMDVGVFGRHSQPPTMPEERPEDDASLTKSPELELQSPELDPDIEQNIPVEENQSQLTESMNKSKDTQSLESRSGEISLDKSKSSSIDSAVGRVARFFRRRRHRDEYGLMKAEFIEEMRYLSKLRHPCVTTVMGAVISPKVEPMLVMEFMDHGSLYDILHNETVHIDGDILLPALRDIAQGMRFLHAATPKVIHGDLKAQNVLVDSRFRAKVADFGLSAKRTVGATGTPPWMAPELLRGESPNSAASDVYSFGIILYEVYSRKDPYEGEDMMEVLRNVADPEIQKRPIVPAACPTHLATLMQDCWNGDPDLRPKFEEIDLRLKRLDAKNVEPGDTYLSKRARDMLNASKNEDLLSKIFPSHIAEALREGRKVEPEKKDVITIFFSDIVGFTTISQQITPVQVSDMLDRLYLSFDDLTLKYDIFKVETVGDAYMCATNLVKDQNDDHVKRIAMFAFDAMKAASETLINLEDPSMGCVRIRVGFHSGPVIARVIGSRTPKYGVFGDTVNTASRMESSSLPGKIQCSDRAAELLRMQSSDVSIISRGTIQIKGKGEMETFFVQPGANTTSLIDS